MIAEFSIKNFKSIRAEQRLSFEATPDTYLSEESSVEVKDGVRLLKLGIIYGANASGKSNVLHALDYFRTLVCFQPSDRNESLGVVPFMLDDTSADETSEMSMTFYLDKEKYVLSIEFDNTRIYKETLSVYLTARPTELYTRKYNKDTDSSEISFSVKLGLLKKSQRLIEGNTINNRTVLAAFSVSNVESSRLNKVYDFFNKTLEPIIEPNLILSPFIHKTLEEDRDGSVKEFILKFLKASDFNISGIEWSRGLPVRFQHKTNGGVHTLSEDMESSGTMRFMGMTFILQHLLGNNHFVIMDEVESSIHYELLSYFLKVFLVNSERESQLLVTTHDINLLNEDFIRRDEIWFTDKNEDGETELKRLTNLGLSKRLSPYNAYKQGKLVNLPFVGSAYLNLNDVD